MSIVFVVAMVQRSSPSGRAAVNTLGCDGRARPRSRSAAPVRAVVRGGARRRLSPLPRRWRSRRRRRTGGRRCGWCCSRARTSAASTFYTNYESRKGGELDANPHAALLFHWQPLGRQVRVEGRVERVPSEESEAYFRTRPLGSRLAAWASPQSRPLADRDELERLYAEAAGAVRRGRAAAAALGRLPARPGRVRVLAARRRPPARPRALRARRPTAGRASRLAP